MNNNQETIIFVYTSTPSPILFYMLRNGSSPLPLTPTPPKQRDFLEYNYGIGRKGPKAGDVKGLSHELKACILSSED